MSATTSFDQCADAVGWVGGVLLSEGAIGCAARSFKIGRKHILARGPVEPHFRQRQPPQDRRPQEAHYRWHHRPLSPPKAMQPGSPLSATQWYYLVVCFLQYRRTHQSTGNNMPIATLRQRISGGLPDTAMDIRPRLDKGCTLLTRRKPQQQVAA
jgi:hypothetical protein